MQNANIEMKVYIVGGRASSDSAVMQYCFAIDPYPPFSVIFAKHGATIGEGEGKGARIFEF